MFCCLSKRRRRKESFDHSTIPQNKTPKRQAQDVDGKSGNLISNDIKDGNMVLLAGVGASVVATEATAAVVVAANESERAHNNSDGGGPGGCGGCGG